MNLLFWTGSKSQELTQAVRANLESEFKVGPESLAKLSSLEKNGKFAGRKVRFIRIFDPALISNSDGSKLKYQDFQETEDREALRFEGHIELNGPIYLADRRPKVANGLTQDSD
ncbi:MAG: hypothetical protein O3A93_12110 [Chloroflexi bacterium]|nr:hypothetical protein [Chloroflexota bacterium]PKB58136.1 MAG: hypothetical protein BZY83_08775 [SAR202 cluster bacterium Casp-Chloro-G2]